MVGGGELDVLTDLKHGGGGQYHFRVLFCAAKFAARMTPPAIKNAPVAM